MRKRGFATITCGSMLVACLTTMAADRPAQKQFTSISAQLANRLEQAIDKNPRILATAAAVETARARREAASRPLYNPDLRFDFEQAEDDTAALGLSQTFDWGNKRSARTQVANYELEMAQAVLAQLRHTVAARLIGKLGSYRTAREVERVASRRVQLMKRFASLAEQRSRAGDLGQVDLNLARLALTEARLQQSQAALDRLGAELAVNRITNHDFASWPTLPAAGISIPDKGPAVRRYLLSLPAMRIAQARVAAARATIKVHTGETRPDPTLSVRGGIEDDSSLAGLSLSIPLYVRNNFSAEVDAANAELIKAQRRARNVFKQARARLIAAAARLRLTVSTWHHWHVTGQQRLRAQLGLLQRLWEVGELSGAEYIVQTRQALDTRVSALRLKGRLWRTWAEWLRVSGEINRWLHSPN